MQNFVPMLYPTTLSSCSRSGLASLLLGLGPQLPITATAPLHLKRYASNFWVLGLSLTRLFVLGATFPSQMAAAGFCLGALSCLGDKAAGYKSHVPRFLLRGGSVCTSQRVLTTVPDSVYCPSRQLENNRHFPLYQNLRRFAAEPLMPLAQ